MNPPDLIANKILEFLRPDSYDDHEEKLLKERDEIRKGEVILIDCLHRPSVVLSNGVTQCMGKCQKLWVPEKLKGKGLYDNNPKVIWVKEE